MLSEIDEPQSRGSSAIGVRWLILAPWFAQEALVRNQLVSGPSGFAAGSRIEKLLVSRINLAIGSIRHCAVAHSDAVFVNVFDGVT